MQAIFTELLNQFCHQTGPARLMAGTQTGPVIAVKIFIEKNKIAPVGVVVNLFQAPVKRAPSRFVFQKMIWGGTISNACLKPR